MKNKFVVNAYKCQAEVEVKVDEGNHQLLIQAKGTIEGVLFAAILDYGFRVPDSNSMRCTSLVTNIIEVHDKNVFIDAVTFAVEESKGFRAWETYAMKRADKGE